MTAERRPVPRGNPDLERQSEQLQVELARLLAVASERRAKMGPATEPKRGGQAA